MPEAVCDLSPEDKRAALELVLRSRALARCDQLRKFLRYVCEEELAGRAGELNEYRIGVEALGRSKRFSAGDDSIVRNRAYALRHKLDEYYTLENPETPIRIRLPKGSYAPLYVPRWAEAEAGEEETTPPPVRPLEHASKRRLPAAAFAAGALASAAVALVLWSVLPPPRGGPAGDEVVKEFWGSLLDRDADVLVCIGTPPQMVVRQFPVSPDDPVPRYRPVPPEVAEQIRRTRQVPPGNELRMLTTNNSPLWGEAMGALAAVGVLAGAGATYHVLPERVVSFPLFRARNVLLFGVPEYSNAADHLLERATFTVAYSPEVQEQVIWKKDAGGRRSPAFVPARDRHGEQVKTYGLITVLPSEGDDSGRRRTVVFSGLNSASAQAAGEFFSAPEALRQFRSRLRKAGYPRIPAAYQVVVESTATSTLPLSVAYTAHSVLSR